MLKVSKHHQQRELSRLPSAICQALARSDCNCCNHKTYSSAILFLFRQPVFDDEPVKVLQSLSVTDTTSIACRMFTPNTLVYLFFFSSVFLCLFFSCLAVHHSNRYRAGFKPIRPCSEKQYGPSYTFQISQYTYRPLEFSLRTYIHTHINL